MQLTASGTAHRTLAIQINDSNLYLGAILLEMLVLVLTRPYFGRLLRTDLEGSPKHFEAKLVQHSCPCGESNVAGDQSAQLRRVKRAYSKA